MLVSIQTKAPARATEEPLGSVPPGKTRNRPTALGKEAGAHLARFCDQAEMKKTTLHPRCKTCAFRAGSIPNGCESTVMDALKCSMEDTPFMCHERKGQPCSP